MSARADYLAWRSLPAVGCMFARLLSKRPLDCGQKIAEVKSDGPPERIARSVATRIDRLVADPSVSAATLLLPGLDALEKLTRMAVALGNRPAWHVRMTTLPGTPGGDMVAVNIVREVPFQGASCPSEALVSDRLRRSPRPGAPQ